MTKASPLSIVRERFGDKASLVKEIQGLTKSGLWIDRESKDKGLGRVSNKKLLHLHEIFSKISDQFGSRDGLISEICQLEKRKDEGYRTRLNRFPVPRLWDHYRAIKKREKKSV